MLAYFHTRLETEKWNETAAVNSHIDLQESIDLSRNTHHFPHVDKATPVELHSHASIKFIRKEKIQHSE